MKNFLSNTDHKKYFKDIANHYGEKSQLNIEYLENLKAAATIYIKGKVLDIGNGGLVCFDYKKAQSIVLADIVVDLIKHPKYVDKGKINEFKDKVKCVEANVMELPFKDSSFDVVILFNVAHHLSVRSLKKSQANVNTAFKEIYRVLKKEGVFLLSESSPHQLIKIINDLGYNFWYFALSKIGIPLPYFLSERQIKSYTEKNGFKLKSKKLVKFGHKVYQPLIPVLSPPGWLWEILLHNNIYVLKK